jgi:hypothetical protein
LQLLLPKVNSWPLFAGGVTRQSHKSNERKMKKIFLLVSLSLLMAVTSAKASASTTAPLLGLRVSFSTHAYWDGVTKSCLPRPKGWCLHFEIEAITIVQTGSIRGDISNLATTGLTLSFNKKTGIASETFSRYFSNGRFWLEGEGTIAGDVLARLGLPASYVIPEGWYNYAETGDMVTIIFRK